jgi:hypothetical protein
LLAEGPLDALLRWDWPWNRRWPAPEPSDPTVHFDLDHELEIASLATVSYCQAPNIVAWNCSRCRNVPDFRPSTAAYDASWDLQAYRCAGRSCTPPSCISHGTVNAHFPLGDANGHASARGATSRTNVAMIKKRLHDDI